MLTKLSKLPRLSKKLIMIFTDSLMLIFVLWASYSIRLDLWYLPKDDTIRLILAAPIIGIPIFSILGLYKSIIRHIDIKSLGHIFLAVTLYALIQSYFQFLPFEVAWINSDLSIVNNQNMFIKGRGIRPFSFFASNSEYAYFTGIYLLCFIRSKKYLWALLSLISLALAGSRGVILAFILAYVIIYLFKIRSKFKVVSWSILIGFSVYFFLIYSSSLFFNISSNTQSRYFLYGTLYGRFETIQQRLTEVNYVNILIPRTFENYSFADAANVTFDNLHLTLLFNFGLIGYFIFWNFFKVSKWDATSLFFISFFVITGFVNDMIYSFYMFYLVLFSILSNKTYE